MDLPSLDGSLPLLVVGLAVVAVLVVAYLTWRAGQRRREALRQLAMYRGWRFVDRDDSLVGLLRHDFPLLRAGNGARRCRNVMHASTPDGLPCLLFDYSYQVRRSEGPDNSSSTRTERHAVAVVELGASLPELRLAPESFLTRVASAVGFGDIDVESAEFNRRFRVRAGDRTHAFDVLHPRTIAFLLDQRLDSWELVGRRLLVSRDGRWALEDYDRVLAEVQRFVDLVPDYVWRKHGAEPAS